MTNEQKKILSMLEISAVRADDSEADAKAICDTARQYACACVFSMPCFVPEALEWLKGSGVPVGGAIGFPSGDTTTASKVFETKEFVKLGCGELDMVINLGYVKSARWDDVLADIKSVREACPGLPLKVIIEISLLTGDEVKRACEAIVKSGADYVKSATGWKAATTLEHVRMIKSVVGNDVKIKAAGGIRGLKTIQEMHEAGVTRFGIGIRSVQDVVAELQA